ncbi:sugar ABC transporter ATP-binding protein [Kitasatospora aureofaciens]|uniref:sugar ABC transporter ATP-binding protein n=1 Tax=Kitasatospora aureofaciens TaxID=1894 RepID=UPI0036F4A63D
MTKQYGAVSALRWNEGGRLDLHAGEIHGLVGENGAGKSTLMSILAGMNRPTSGSVTLNTQPYSPASVVEARRLGVEIVLQDFGLAGSLTVAENFFLGHHHMDSRAGFVRRRYAAGLVREALAEIAPWVTPGTRADTLSLEDQKLVELARAIHFRPSVLLVDEATACLGQGAAQKLFEALQRERARGTAILYISHHLEEIRRLCDRVTVMRDGQLVATLPARGVEDRTLTTLMVGREVDLSSHRGVGAGREDKPRLSASGLALDGCFDPVDLDLYAGEIVGIGGLVGCGVLELGRVLCGAMKPTSGSMTLGEKEYAPRSTRAAIRQGVSYVPPDRDREGLLLRQSIAENAVLAQLPRGSRLGWYSGRRDTQLVAPMIDRLGIRCQGPRQCLNQLSGGNRQKVVLAKAMLTKPRVLVLHNPTRGVDVGAKSDIYSLLSELADQGMALLLISEELPELIAMSDRIIIMHKGRVTRQVSRSDAPSEDDLITYMV